MGADFSNCGIRLADTNTVCNSGGACKSAAWISAVGSKAQDTATATAERTPGARRTEFKNNMMDTTDKGSRQRPRRQ
jgi:hypothetical protein